MLCSLENYYWRYCSASELVNMILAFIETRQQCPVCIVLDVVVKYARFELFEVCKIHNISCFRAKYDQSDESRFHSVNLVWHCLE